MRWANRLSITARMTLATLLIATIVATGAVIALSWVVGDIVYGTAQTLLDRDVAAAEAQVKHPPFVPDSMVRDGQYIAVVNPAGLPVFSTFPRNLRHQWPQLRQLWQRAEASRLPATAEVQSRQSLYLVRIAPVMGKTGLWNVIGARRLDDEGLLLIRLTWTMAAVATLVVAASGFAAWLLSRAALQPVERMRLRAEQIADSGGSGLLPRSRVKDELDGVAATLNRLLIRQRRAREREARLLSDASHELRAPLTALRGQLEVAVSDAGDAAALLADVKEGLRSVDRLVRLSNNLLELSRIDAGGAAGQASWPELVEQLADAVDRVRLARPDTSAEVEFQAENAPEAELAVRLHGQDFGRIAENLLSNAAAAVDRSGRAGRVLATLRGTHDAAVLQVSDDAGGMPPEFLPLAVRRFARAAEAAPGEGGGGLGLSIVDALATAAGGSLELVNTADGLRASVVLPWG